MYICYIWMNNALIENIMYMYTQYTKQSMNHYLRLSNRNEKGKYHNATSTGF